VSQAVATFTKMGYDVFLPLTESAPYDLIVDTGGRLIRVQVRFTSTGEADLRRVHSNSKGYVVKKTRENAYDWLYILQYDGTEYTEYLVKKCLHNRRAIRPTSEHLLKVPEI